MDSTCYLNRFFGCGCYGTEGMVLGMWYFSMIKTKSQCPWGTVLYESMHLEKDLQLWKTYYILSKLASILRVKQGTINSVGVADVYWDIKPHYLQAIFYEG